jgi:tetratricopeptide (TPR) repeat protein
LVFRPKKVTFHKKLSIEIRIEYNDMHKIISYFLILYVGLCQSVQAQQEESENYLEVRGISELAMEPLSRATANLYEGNTKVKSVQTSSDGTFSFKLDFNKQYTIEVEKDGLVSKRISFNTQMPADEKGTWMNEFSVGLVKPCGGVDYSILREPVDKIRFDAKRREFISDKDYVSSMRPKIESLMAKSDQCMLNTYESLIKKADQTAGQKNFQEAIDTYREALKIYPSEEYPAKRISELNAQINKQQFSSEAYQKVISEADALLAQGKNSEALQKYKQASVINPQEIYPKQKAGEIETSLAQQSAAKQAQQNVDDRYNQAMAKASVAYTRKDYAAAKQYYQEALTIKPAESLPKSRVQEIETIQAKKASEDAAKSADAAKKAAFEKEYLNLVAQADEQFKARKYEEAKTSYARAMTMKPAESYPAQRLKTIENAVAAEQASIEKSKDENYNSAMAAANNALAKSQYQLARDSYQKALSIKPDDLAAKSRLAEVDRLEQEFAKQKSVLEQYQNLIQSGDALMAHKNLAEAKETYTKALALKPGDKYAQTKITAIENSIAAEQANLLKTKNENYNASISAGNNALVQNQFSIARENFQKALAIKPEDQTAKSRLTETDRLEAQFTKQKSVDEQYKKIIQTADALLSSKDLNKARESYTQALSIKPGDQYAQQKIATIDNTMAVEQAALLKSRNDNYNAAIISGNDALAINQFSVARESFQKALSIKPEDQIARGRLAETDRLEAQFAKQKSVDEQYKKIIQTADALLTSKELGKARDSYNQALSVKPGDQYAQLKITSIDNAIASQQAAKLKATEEGYQASIGAANTAITQKSYTQAKEFLQKALSIKPGDIYASGKISEVDRLIAEQQTRIEQEKQLAAQYREIIASADKSFNERAFSAAKTSYTKALQIKPGDTYANQRIAAINDLIATETANKQKQTEEAYASAMLKGNNAISAKDYKSARDAYQQALTIKPADSNARQKLTETDLLIKQEQEKLLAEQARKRKFDETVKTGDQQFTQKNYSGAKLSYEQALTIIPGETYPRQKLEETIRLIADQERILAENKAKETAYNQALVNADKYFRAKDYNQARDEYTRAMGLKPSEAFPKTRITEIESIIAARQKEMDAIKARTDAYTAAINSGSQAFNKKEYTVAKTSYTEALKYMPGDILATDQIKKIDLLIAEADRNKKAEEAKKASLNALIASADKLFDEGRYPNAKEEYKKILVIEPGNIYAKQRIAKIDEINRVLAQSQAKTTPTTATVPARGTAAIAMRELNFKNESEKQKYLDELKSKYPEGITLEKYKEQYKETYRYIIIREGQASEFRFVKFTTYSGAQYSVNGKPITQQYFLSQTKTRAGENFREIDM